MIEVTFVISFETKPVYKMNMFTPIKNPRSQTTFLHHKTTSFFYTTIAIPKTRVMINNPDP